LVGQPAAITLSGRSFLCGHELQLPELPLPLPLPLPAPWPRPRPRGGQKNKTPLKK
jgi:hypothetical protein